MEGKLKAVLLLPPRRCTPDECKCELCERTRVYIKHLRETTEKLCARVRRSAIITAEDLAMMVY